MTHRRIRRFDIPTRLLHWTNAALFVALLISGFLLYVPSVKVPELGGYRLAALLHIGLGAAFIVAPLVVAVLARRRRVLAEDVAGALTPEGRDVDWLRWATLATLGARLRQPRIGKYNAGQKLNTWYWLLAWAALSATGMILAINVFDRSIFGVRFLGEVFTVHEVIALASIVPLAGHLYLSLIHPSTRPALSGIVSGEVDAAWAAEHHAGWYDDLAKTGP